MNSRAPGLESAERIGGAGPRFRKAAGGPAPRRVGARLLVALILSVGLHLLLVGGTLLGWWDLWPWLTPAEPPQVVVRAHLLPPPPPPPPVVPETAPKPAVKPAAAAPAPVRRPRPVPAAPDVLTADGPAVAAAGPAAASAEAPRVAEPAPTTVAPAAIAPPAAPAAGPARPTSLPPRARIQYEITSEANNMRLLAVQKWEMKDGRYRTGINGEFKVFGKVFVSISAESSGAVTAAGLRMDHYEYARNAKRAVVNIAPDLKSAAIDEMSGNHKTVPLDGQTVNLANLAYHLAFVPDMAIGTSLAFFNRDELEEVRLVDRRDELISLDSINVQTRYFEFRRADGSGGAQIWLATDHQWLPAKMRIAARDGVLVFTVTRYDLNPPD